MKIQEQQAERKYFKKQLKYNSEKEKEKEKENKKVGVRLKKEYA